MRKLSLSEWAQIGEVVGMVAVVFSLLMVVYSINQNTIALRGSNANLIFERHAELQALFIADDEKISESRWDDNKDSFGESFWNHVNDALFQRLRHASGE